MKKLTILAAAVMAAGAIWAAGESVTIHKAQQRYPWNDKIDIDWSFTCDPTHRYTLKFMLIDGAVTNIIETDIHINPVHNISSKSGRTTIDIPTQAPAFDEKLRTGGIQIMGVLTDRDVIDRGDGVTFEPGDYLCLNLADGTVTQLLNVQNAEQYNIDLYKTTLMLFRRIPAGAFYMQATESVNITDPSGTPKTGSMVSIPEDYYIAVFPCTVAQYNVIVGTGATTDTRAKGGVCWNMIATAASPQIITNLNARINGEYEIALPNEAQWERAARAGTTMTWYFGPSSSTLGNYAWYNGNSGNAVRTVGSKNPNAWGLYDMYGNVWEWCSDWFGTINYEQQPGGPATGSNRVIRGGSYYYDASLCSSVGRSYGTPSSTYGDFGFRLIMTLK